MQKWNQPIRLIENINFFKILDIKYLFYFQFRYVNDF